MHFGLHLKKIGLISAEQLVAALEIQLNTLVPIGQLALEEGILSRTISLTFCRHRTMHLKSGSAIWPSKWG